MKKRRNDNTRIFCSIRTDKFILECRKKSIEQQRTRNSTAPSWMLRSRMREPTDRRFCTKSTFESSPRTYRCVLIFSLHIFAPPPFSLFFSFLFLRSLKPKIHRKSELSYTMLSWKIFASMRCIRSLFHWTCAISLDGDACAYYVLEEKSFFHSA